MACRPATNWWLLLLLLATVDGMHYDRYPAYVNFTYVLPGMHGPGAKGGTMTAGNWTCFDKPVLRWVQGQQAQVEPEYLDRVHFNTTTGDLTLRVTGQQDACEYLLRATAESDRTDKLGLPADTILMPVWTAVPPYLELTPTERPNRCGWLVTCRQSQPAGRVEWTDQTLEPVALHGDQMVELVGGGQHLGCQTVHANGPTLVSQPLAVPPCRAFDRGLLVQELNDHHVSQTIMDWMLVLSADAAVALLMLAGAIWCGRRPDARRPPTPTMEEMCWAASYRDEDEDEEEITLLCAQHLREETTA